MKLLLLTKSIIGVGAAAAISMSAQPIQSVLFEGDYGGNRNSALGNAMEFHFEDEGDFNGDGITDTRRYIPILFPYPGLDHGPIVLDFQIDQDLFGKSGFFYTGSQIVSYGAVGGVYPSYGLYRWGSGPQAIQLTSGNVSPTDDMGFLASIFAIKEDFLNGADEIEDLKLPNEADGFTAEVFFRGAPKVDVEPEGLRRARFFIQAGENWYISQTGTAGEGEELQRDVTRTLSVNPAAEYWYEYNVQTMQFMQEEEGTAAPMGTATRGDALSNIQAVGVIMQNTRFDGTLESHYVWLNFNEFSFHLDPNPEPVVDEEPEPWIDTGEWLGMVYNEYAPWVHSGLLSKWLYMPEQPTEEGGWIFIPMVHQAEAE